MGRSGRFPREGAGASRPRLRLLIRRGSEERSDGAKALIAVFFFFFLPAFDLFVLNERCPSSPEGRTVSGG